MKSIISKAVFLTAIVACLAFGTQAKTISHVSATVTTVADTGKMKMDKMKMKKKKMGKMSKDKMKMDKMKMSKDTGKM